VAKKDSRMENVPENSEGGESCGDLLSLTKSVGGQNVLPHEHEVLKE
jgi:hypothetical protein